VQGDTGEATARQQPLTREEMERLWRWERHMTWLYMSAMGALLLGSIAINRFGDLPWLRGLVLTAVMVLVTAAAVLQLRGRCPRCHARLRSKLMTVLPDKCARCGVDFPRPPQIDR
jgi:hypothetical protein